MTKYADLPGSANVVPNLWARGFGAGTAELSGSLIAFLAVTGIAFGAVLAATSEVGPLATAAWRMLLAAPICFVLCLSHSGIDNFRSMAALLQRPDTWLAGAAFALVLLLWYSGQRLSSVASTSALHNMTPMYVLGFMWLVHCLRPEKRTVWGVGLGIAGASLLAWHSDGTAEHGLIGDALAAGSAACLATYYLIVTRLAGQAPAMVIMTVVSLTALPIALPAALLLEIDVLPSGAGGWLTLLGVALCGQVIGQALLAYAARRLGAGGISVITLAEPALATLLSVMLMAVAFSSLQALAIGLTIFGVYLSQQQFNRQAKQLSDRRIARPRRLARPAATSGRRRAGQRSISLSKSA